MKVLKIATMIVNASFAILCFVLTFTDGYDKLMFSMVAIILCANLFLLTTTSSTESANFLALYLKRKKSNENLKKEHQRTDEIDSLKDRE